MREQAMKQTRRPRLGAQGWREVLDQFAKSGMSAVAFCEREGLSSKSFYRWRDRLDGLPNQHRAARAEPSGPSPSPGFIDLGALRSGGARLELRLDLGGGVLVHLVRE
jgi:putative transposase